MPFSLNRIMLIGNLGNDAETRFTPNTNTPVTSFSLATTYSYKNKEGNWINETTWHNIVAYGLSDFYRDSLKKGKKFYIEGRLIKRDYTDKEGVKKYVTEVVADRFGGIIPLESREGQSIASEEGAPYTAGEKTDNAKEEEDLPF